MASVNMLLMQCISSVVGGADMAIRRSARLGPVSRIFDTILRAIVLTLALMTGSATGSAKWLTVWCSTTKFESKKNGVAI
jgi:hypothetical protein